MYDRHRVRSKLTSDYSIAVGLGKVGSQWVGVSV